MLFVFPKSLLLEIKLSDINDRPMGISTQTCTSALNHFVNSLQELRNSENVLPREKITLHTFSKISIYTFQLNTLCVVLIVFCFEQPWNYFWKKKCRLAYTTLNPLIYEYICYSMGQRKCSFALTAWSRLVKQCRSKPNILITA